jgi:hypothetical protein
MTCATATLRVPLGYYWIVHCPPCVCLGNSHKQSATLVAQTGWQLLLFVSLSGKKNLGIGSEVLLMTELVTQKFNGDETHRDTRKPQRGPESC